MDILTDNLVRTEFNFEEVHSLSMDLLSFMEENNVLVGVGAVAAMLTVGRLLEPDMSVDEEVRFIQDAMQWAGMRVVDGEVH